MTDSFEASCRFLQLPLELRVQIYQYAIDDTQVVIQVRKPSSNSPESSVGNNVFTEVQNNVTNEVHTPAVSQLIYERHKDDPGYFSAFKKRSSSDTCYETRLRYRSALLMTCRQVRDEMQPMFRPGTIVFFDYHVDAAKQYLCDLTPLALNSITHMCISRRTGFCANLTCSKMRDCGFTSIVRDSPGLCNMELLECLTVRPANRCEHHDTWIIQEFPSSSLPSLELWYTYRVFDDKDVTQKIPYMEEMHRFLEYERNRGTEWRIDSRNGTPFGAPAIPAGEGWVHRVARITKVSQSDRRRWPV